MTDGGLVRVVSVAGRVQSAPFDKGLAALKRAGLGVEFDEQLLDTGHPYLAADAPSRSADLQSAFAGGRADVVLCARGGYGSMHLLPGLDIPAIVRSQTAFVGFSDNTALHLALNAAGLVTFHGPVVTALGANPDPDEAVHRMVSVLGHQTPSVERLQGVPIQGGRRAGRFVGGNLALLTSCLAISACGLQGDTILLIEEIGEPLYRIDRMLTGLVQSGLLDPVVGFALGSFALCGDGPDGPSRAAEVCVECLARLGRPIVVGLPVGHRSVDLTVPLGVDAVIDGDVGFVELTRPGGP